MKIIIENKYGKHEIFLDDEDFSIYTEYYWFISKVKKSNNVLYYLRGVKKGDKEERKLLFHRIIMNAKKGEMIDHIDGNGLNNQKNNLRFTNYTQNNRNRKKYKGKSKYKGVIFNSSNGRKKHWHSYIKINRKSIYLGSFFEENDAALAYNKAAKKYFGEFAYLNEIGG